jgi:hypothetical protein
VRARGSSLRLSDASPVDESPAGDPQNVSLHYWRCHSSAGPTEAVHTRLTPSRWNHLAVAAFALTTCVLACRPRGEPGTYEELWLARACGWKVLAGCENLPAFSGPLAGAADSALASGVLEYCIALGAPRWGEFRFAADSSFVACRGSTADTIVDLTLGGAGTVVAVRRQWQPPVAVQAHHTLVAELVSVYGAATACPQSDELAVTDNVRWEDARTNWGVSLLDSTSVVVDRLLGPIDCHRV